MAAAAALRLISAEKSTNVVSLLLDNYSISFPETIQMFFQQIRSSFAFKLKYVIQYHHYSSNIALDYIVLFELFYK